MNLPDKFQFKFFTDNDIYTVVKKGNEYLVTWSHGSAGSCTYSAEIIQRNIEKGNWIIQQEANGVDAEGNPLNFTVEDLKPFMRVVLRNNNRYIVCPSHNGKEVHLVSNNNLVGHNDAYFDANAVGKTTTNFEIVKVYAQPQYWEMLDVYEGGPLLWKATPKEESKEHDKDPFKERIEYFETNLKALSDELVALKAEAN